MRDQPLGSSTNGGEGALAPRPSKYADVDTIDRTGTLRTSFSTVSRPAMIAS